MCADLFVRGNYGRLLHKQALFSFRPDATIVFSLPSRGLGAVKQTEQEANCREDLTVNEKIDNPLERVLG